MSGLDFLKEKYAQADARIAVCKTCPSYIEATTQCKECGCFMRFKVLLPKVKCPLGKW